MFKRKTPVPNDNLQRKMSPPFIFDFTVGDIVKVCSDECKVKELQNSKDCGGYSPQRMQGVLGKCVRVKHISPYCVKVEWDNSEFDFHPSLLALVGQKAVIRNNSSDIKDDKVDNLFEAVEEGNLTVVCEKMKTYLLNVKNNHGRTPISIACSRGHYDVVETLLEFNADLDIPDDDENLPIHHCAWTSNLNILKLIVEKDENQLHKFDKTRKTLLHIAIIINNLEMTKYLIEKKVNVHAEDLQGRTAICYVTNQTDPGIMGLMTAITKTNLIYSLPPDYQQSLYQRNTGISLLDPPIDRSVRSFQNAPSLSFPGDPLTNNYRRYMGSSIPEGFREATPFNTITPPSVSPIPVSLSSAAPTTSSMNEDQNKQNECTICFNRVKKVAFVDCGHTSCRECADKLFQCHICKKEIISKLKIFI